MAENRSTLQNSAGLQGTLVRKDGQVVEATTPFGAKTEGATPDQAKMAGTPAQTAPIVEKKVAKATPQQQQPSVSAAKQAEETAQAQEASKLGSFGGFNDRVKAIVQKNITKGFGANAPEVTAQVADDTIINEAFQNNTTITRADGTETTVQEQLKSFIDNAETGDETPLILISQALSEQTGQPVTKDQIKAWVTADSDIIAQVAGDTIGDHVLMSDFTDDDFAAAGFVADGDKTARQVAADVLGLKPGEDINALTFSEIQERVTEKQQEMFTEIEDLQNQLNQVPPGSAIANQINQKIAALTGAGTATAEARMKELVQDFDEAQTINIFGQDMSVQDALSDQTLSDQIVQYLQAPDDAAREAILPEAEYGPFRDWISSQRKLLDGLVNTLSTTAGTFSQAQTTLQGLTNAVADPKLKDAMEASLGVDLDVLGTMTSQQISKLFEDNPIAKVLTATNATELGISEEELAGIRGAITAETWEQLQGKSMEEIADSYRASLTAQENPEAFELAGISPGTFMTDDESAALDQAMQTINSVNEVGGPGTWTKVKQAPNLQAAITDGSIPVSMLQYIDIADEQPGTSILANDDILDLIRSGDINEQNAEEVLSTASANLRAADKITADLERLRNSSADEYLDYAFHTDTSFEDLTTTYQDAINKKKMGASGPSLDRLISSFEQWDLDKDGQITSADIDQLKAGMTDLPPRSEWLKDLIVDNKQGDVATSQYAPKVDLRDARSMTKGVQTAAIYDQIAEFMKDGTVDQTEAESLWKNYPGATWWDKIDEGFRKDNFPEGYRNPEDFQNRDKAPEETAPQASVSLPGSNETLSSGTTDRIREKGGPVATTRLKDLVANRPGTNIEFDSGDDNPDGTPIYEKRPIASFIDGYNMMINDPANYTQAIPHAGPLINAFGIDANQMSRISPGSPDFNPRVDANTPKDQASGMVENLVKNASGFKLPGGKTVRKLKFELLDAQNENAGRDRLAKIVAPLTIAMKESMTPDEVLAVVLPLTNLEAMSR